MPFLLFPQNWVPFPTVLHLNIEMNIMHADKSLTEAVFSAE